MSPNELIEQERKLKYIKGTQDMVNKCPSMNLALFKRIHKALRIAEEILQHPSEGTDNG